MKHNKKTKNSLSFTLIELMVVIAIIGLLSSIVLIAVKGARERAKIAGVLQFSSTIHHALGSNSNSVWDFLEGSGTQTYDNSGYNHNGVLGDGSCTPGNGNCPTWVDSGWPFGTVLEFDRTRNTYVNVGTFDVKGSAMTIIAWFNLTNLDSCGGPGISDCRIVCKSDGNSSFSYTWCLSIGKEPSDPSRFIFKLKKNGDLNATTLTSNDAGLSNNIWTFVAAVYDGRRMKIYKDNAVLLGENDAGTIKTIAEEPLKLVYIGRNPGSTGTGFPGKIDRVAIYEEALSIGQINKLYAEGIKEFKLSKK